MDKTQMDSIRKTKLSILEKQSLPFYCLLMIFPIAQFCVFYIFVNFNSILMAFQEYNLAEGSVHFTLKQFQLILSEFADHSMVTYLINSLVLYGIGVLITPLTLFFSFYVYKKFPLSGVFKVFLFLPSIISSMVLVVIFTKIVEFYIPTMIWKITGNRPDSLMSAGASTVLPTLMFFTIFNGFGASMLMYSGAMGQTSDSVVEAARVDGANMMQEFIHITLPSIYPTFTTFMVAGVAGIFTNQMNLFSFYGPKAQMEYRTIGYYIFMKVAGESVTKNDYNYAAAIGIVSSAILIPTTFIIKYIMEKFGPSED